MVKVQLIDWNPADDKPIPEGMVFVLLRDGAGIIGNAGELYWKQYSTESGGQYEIVQYCHIAM